MTRRQRTQKVPVALPTANTLSAGWLRSIRVSGFTIVALLLVILTVIVLAPSLKILVEQRQQVASLRGSLAQEQKAVDDLGKQRARWNDPSYLQAQARERLDYVYPGDFSFLVIDDGKSEPAVGQLPISSDIQTATVDWVGALMTSVFTAGLTDAPRGAVATPAPSSTSAPSAPAAPSASATPTTKEKN
ncbi:MAG: septum formation initiator family protein [Microbacteriaceae bacterium]|nr:septum formation initiator family protein [Microbacteriaceae bacterium]